MQVDAGKVLDTLNPTLTLMSLKCSYGNTDKDAVGEQLQYIQDQLDANGIQYDEDMTDGFPEDPLFPVFVLNGEQVSEACDLFDMTVTEGYLSTRGWYVIKLESSDRQAAATLTLTVSTDNMIDLASWLV